MQLVRIVIVGDIDSRGVKVEGPLDDMRVVHWLLGEAVRYCNRDANAREAAVGGNGHIVVAPGNALDGLVKKG